MVCSVDARFSLWWNVSVVCLFMEGPTTHVEKLLPYLCSQAHRPYGNQQKKYQQRYTTEQKENDVTSNLYMLRITSLTAWNPRLAWWSQLEGVWWPIGEVPKCCCFRFSLGSKPWSDTLKSKLPTHKGPNGLLSTL